MPKHAAGALKVGRRDMPQIAVAEGVVVAQNRWQPPGDTDGEFGDQDPLSRHKSSRLSRSGSIFGVGSSPRLAPAGLDGIANKRDPGEPKHVNMYTEGHKVKSAPKLPATLHDALRLLEKSKPIADAWGRDVVDSYIKLKMGEWSDYTAHLSDWERHNTLDC